jgi:hypothetical protein
MPDDKPPTRRTAFGIIGGPPLDVGEYNELVRNVAALQAESEARAKRAAKSGSKGGKAKPPPRYEELIYIYVAAASAKRPDIDIGRDLRKLWEKYAPEAWSELLPETDEGLADGVGRIRKRLADEKEKREKSSGL